MRITRKWLERHHACARQVDIFVGEWPDGADLTAENIRRAMALGLDLWWLAAQVLKDRAQIAAYREALGLADAAYQEATGPALAAYREALGLALAAYQEATGPALAAYQEATGPALAAYQEATGLALAAYQEGRELALIAALGLEEAK